MEHAPALGVGSRAPDFTLPKQDGSTIRLGDLCEQAAVVLWFYEKAEAPAAVAEACAFQKSLEAFRSRGVEVVGMSADDLDAQRAFAKKYRIEFPLLADATGMVCGTYGALNGRGARHMTYLIGKGATVTHVFERVVPERHPGQLLETIDGLKKPAAVPGRNGTHAPGNGVAATASKPAAVKPG